MRPPRILASSLVVALAAALLVIPTAPRSAVADRDETFAHETALLDGVRVVGRPGAPGVVSVFGDDAFAVLTGGARDAPKAVVAASRLGEGRIVALAHDGWLNFEFLARDEGARRLILNALRWTGGAKEPRVALLGARPELKSFLIRTGFDVEGAGAAKGLVKVVADPDVLDDRAAAEIERHLRAGGGLVVAMCPWGWEQIHAQEGLRLRTDSRVNRLLAKAGLAFADGIPAATADEGFAVEESSPDAVHAGRGLPDILVKDSRFSAAAIVDAIRALPPAETEFRARVERFVAQFRSGDMPRPDRPLRRRSRTDLGIQIAVAWWSVAWRDLPPDSVDAAPGSDAFPGTDEGVSPQTVALSFEPDVPGWRSTGLYLRPGEVLTVVPRAPRADSGAAGETAKADATPPRWRVRIGCHTDSLWHLDKIPRWPEIAHAAPLAARATRVATPWGGPVYFEPLDGAARLDVEVRGAIAAPYFDLRDPERAKSWPRRRRAAAPWAELAGEHLVLSLPSAAVRALDDPEPLLRWWDSVVASHCELAGVPVPARPERFVCDVEISAGSMHAGYPIMMHLDVGAPAGAGSDARPAPLVDLAALRKAGTWGPFHELGHNRQRAWWTFDGTGEVTCNLFSLFTGERLCGIRPWENPWLVAQRGAAAAYVAAPDFAKWKESPGVALTTYGLVQREFGWAPFQRVFREMEALPAAARPTADQDKIDTFVLRLSAACGRDLRPYFRRWAWPLSDATLRDETVAKLPPWEPDLSDLAAPPRDAPGRR